jgi:hypothetical protein
VRHRVNWQSHAPLPSRADKEAATLRSTPLFDLSGSSQKNIPSNHSQPKLPASPARCSGRPRPHILVCQLLPVGSEPSEPAAHTPSPCPSRDLGVVVMSELLSESSPISVFPCSCWFLTKLWLSAYSPSSSWNPPRAPSTKKVLVLASLYNNEADLIRWLIDLHTNVGMASIKFLGSLQEFCHCSAEHVRNTGSFHHCIHNLVLISVVSGAMYLGRHHGLLLGFYLFVILL